MKKRIGLVLLAVCLLILAGCKEAPGEVVLPEEKYRVKILEDFPIVSQLEQHYSAGDKVTIVLDTQEEYRYTVKVNGQLCQQDEERSNSQYTYFTFSMPGEDVLVAIEKEIVLIRETEPTVPEVTEPEILQPEPADEDFVNVRAYIPDIAVELAYSGEDNFTGQKIYDFSEAWLRYGTVKKLILVQQELRQQGLGLKIWDGFRPTAAQFKLWEVYPVATYVANPNSGFSSHSRGNTVDITLVYADGSPVIMPTGFDDFSRLADRNYGDCSPEAAENARLLEQLMKKHGFSPYYGEWWHFTDTTSYPVEKTFTPVREALYWVCCEEGAQLLTKPQGDTILRLLDGETVCVVARYGEYALVTYGDLFGYVLARDLIPLAD